MEYREYRFHKRFKVMKVKVWNWSLKEIFLQSSISNVYGFRFDTNRLIMICDRRKESGISIESPSH